MKMATQHAGNTTSRFYFAYGSNCNLDQMVHRCPRATTIGAVTLRNYTLEFNGVASIRRRNGAEVKGVLWAITADCERSLDRYEGYPSFYTKMTVTVYTDDGAPVKAMVYVMTPRNRCPDFPTTVYFKGIKTGFLQNGISLETLEYALTDTAFRIAKLTGGRRNEATQLAAR